MDKIIKAILLWFASCLVIWIILCLFILYIAGKDMDKINTELQQCQTQLADNTDRVADVIKNDELVRDYADCIYKQVATNKDLDLCDPYYDMAVEFNNLIFKDSEDWFTIVTE